MKVAPCDRRYSLYAVLWVRISAIADGHFSLIADGVSA
jgi:hypothetical protein